MAKCGIICEVFARVVGYYRPVRHWNKGKQQEYKDRVTFGAPFQQPFVPQQPEPKKTQENSEKPVAKP